MNSSRYRVILVAADLVAGLGRTRRLRRSLATGKRTGDGDR